MNRGRRSSLGFGIVLILLGAVFLAFQLIPGLQVRFSWPWIIIGGIGGLLYWQNYTGEWESWAYAWSLIPGFVGVGIIVAGLLGGKLRKSLREGVNLIVISLVLFVIFGAFLDGPNLLGDYWPVLLILLGLWILIRPMFRSK